MSGKTVDIICKKQSIVPVERSGAWAQATLVVLLLVGASLSVLPQFSDLAIAADPASATPAQSLNLQPDSEPLDLKALEPANTPSYLITATKISLTRLTVPSLWWLQEQIADKDPYGGKLLENWLAYPSSGRPGRVDLVVNRQFWSLLDYLDRYAFIHAFGKAARDYGYNVRVFDGQATLLGASTCDFSTISIDALQNSQSERNASTNDVAPTSDLPPQPVDMIPCSIQLDSTGKSGLRGRSNQLPGAGSSKALDTAQP